MEEINLYCDESNHLQHNSNMMTLGYISCPVYKVREYNEKIRNIKERNGLNKKCEIKWTKVSRSKVNFYRELIEMFFNDDDLKFRCIIADKSVLDYNKYRITHDGWYYRMYYLLLGKSLFENNRYNIYIDKKDTCSVNKVRELKKILKNSYYDFASTMISKVQQVDSKEIEIIQLNDIFVGAVGYCNNHFQSSDIKLEMVEMIRSYSNSDLLSSTPLSQNKFNLFVWGNNL